MIILTSGGDAAAVGLGEAGTVMMLTPGGAAAAAEEAEPGRTISYTVGGAAAEPGTVMTSGDDGVPLGGEEGTTLTSGLDGAGVVAGTVTTVGEAAVLLAAGGAAAGTRRTPGPAGGVASLGNTGMEISGHGVLVGVGVPAAETTLGAPEVATVLGVLNTGATSFCTA